MGGSRLGRGERPPPFPRPPPCTRPLETTHLQSWLTGGRSQILGRKPWEKLHAGSPPGVEKGLSCGGTEGTAGLPTAAGSWLVKSGKPASCDLPSAFLFGGGGPTTSLPRADSAAAAWVDGPAGRPQVQRQGGGQRGCFKPCRCPSRVLLGALHTISGRPWSQREGKTSDTWVIPSSSPTPCTHHSLPAWHGTPSGHLVKGNLEEALRDPAPS